MDSGEMRSMIGAAVEQEVGARLRELTGRIAALEARVAGAADPGGGVAPRTAEPAESVDVSPAPMRDAGAPKPASVRTLRPEDVEERATKEWSYQVQGSIWDAALFIGLPAVGGAGSAFLVIGLVCNILLQAIFTDIIGSNFVALQMLPSVEDAWGWREMHGHQFSNMLTDTRTSLVRAVCSGSAATLTTSTWQHNLYTSVRTYTERHPFGIPLGALLCSAVLFLWALSICQELNTIWSFASAVLSLPRAGATKLRLVGGELELPSCTLRRKCCVMAVVVVRWWTAVALLITGSIWLANTLSIVELVLNAAALTFILGVDELIFETLAPLPTRALVRDLRPLARPGGAQFRGLTLGVALNLGSALVIVSIFFTLLVLPHLSAMGDIMGAVCGGFKDFVVSDSALDMVIATETTNPFGGRRQDKSFAQQAVRDVVTLGGVQATNKLLVLPTHEGFVAMQQGSVADLVDLLGSQVLANNCGDYDMSGPGAQDAFRATLQSALGVDVDTCADAHGHCHGDSRLLRLVCPATCGCDDPHSGLYRSGAHDGCPSLCAATGTYIGRLSAIPCADYNTSELLGIPGWERMVTQWADAWDRFEPKLRHRYEAAKLALLARGCGALDLIPARFKTTLCASDLQFASVRPYCPSTCGCAGDFSPECPTQCNGGFP